jgi:hypothetical protein
MTEYTFTPNENAFKTLKTEWAWLLGEHWTPFLFSAIGDVFFTVPAQSVWWLSTATAQVELVAESKNQFEHLLQTEAFDEWFLPGLVSYLQSEGKTLDAGQCYSYFTLPVFEHGSFSAENMFALDAAEHYAGSAKIHLQLRGLQDGSEVTVLVDG